MLLHLRQRQLDFLVDIFQAKSPSVEKSPACHKESSDSSLLATKRKNLAGHRIADEALLPYFRASLELISYTCHNLFRCTVQFYWHFSSCQYLVLITENLNADSLFFFFPEVWDMAYSCSSWLQSQPCGSSSTKRWKLCRTCKSCAVEGKFFYFHILSIMQFGYCCALIDACLDQ